MRATSRTTPRGRNAVCSTTAMVRGPVRGGGVYLQHAPATATAIATFMLVVVTACPGGGAFVASAPNGDAGNKRMRRLRSGAGRRRERLGGGREGLRERLGGVIQAFHICGTIYVSYCFYCFIGGEGGIRTPGSLRINGFQDRRFRPLSHLSGSGREYRIRNCSAKRRRSDSGPQEPWNGGTGGEQGEETMAGRIEGPENGAERPRTPAHPLAGGSLNPCKRY